MNTETLFSRLWKDYAELNPSVARIHSLFESRGEKIINDHVAFRTFNHPAISVDVLEKAFTRLGYHVAGEYRFPDKKLYARHYELKGKEEAPRIFISQLILEDISGSSRELIEKVISRIPSVRLESGDLVFSADIFGKPSFSVYETLRAESEYAAWVYAFGFRANHFTVSVNQLKSLSGIEEVNELLKKEGFRLNTSGGEVKGSRAELLRQSSTLADMVDHSFTEGNYRIPLCYYEFAERFRNKNGELFSGFIAGSADKIFESTDFREKE